MKMNKLTSHNLQDQHNTVVNRVIANTPAREDRVHDIDPGSQEFYNLKARISMLLQTSLDVERVLELFLEQVQAAVPVDGLALESLDGTMSKLGRLSPHHAQYQLTVGDTDIGALRFHRRRAFRESELEKLEHLLGVVVCPLRNALMYQAAVAAAYQDPLTGLGSRRALEMTMERDIGLAMRHQYPVSVLVIDIDHFKKINDTLGHAAGDKVLRATARTIQKELRLTDPAFRYGGEEFVVILNKTSLKGSQGLAERIRQHVADNALQITGRNIHVTVSIGIATVEPGDDMNSLFDRADRALYQAKCSGRNRCVVAEPKSALQVS
jgi:diguanylate cyclase (GGDEF)-like protein